MPPTPPSAPSPPRARDAERTRAAILTAARLRFGAQGYDRTTMRGIAADAGVDPAMVIRYFGSKDALFAEVVEFELHLPDLRDVPPERLAEALLPRFFAVWEDDARFLPLLRAATTSEPAAEAMRTVFARQVAPTLAAVSADHAELRAALFGSQVLGLALARYVLRLPPLAALPRDELVAWVGPVLQQYLVGPAPGLSGSSGG